MRCSGLLKLIINVGIVLALLSISIDMMERQQRLDIVMEHRHPVTERYIKLAHDNVEEFLGHVSRIVVANG